MTNIEKAISIINLIKMEKEKYKIEMVCRNCDYEWVELIPKHEEVRDRYMCPNCECLTGEKK